jgi:hypothetical protein
VRLCRAAFQLSGILAIVPPFSARLCGDKEAAIFMKTIGWICLFVTLGGVAATAAQARGRSFHDQLLKLSLDARVEQRCNERATGVLAREHRLKAPDEVMAYAYADTDARGAFVHAPGAAIRDRGEWYKLAYTCQATPDGLGIVTFEYTLGAKVPHSDWAGHNLSPP